MEQELKPCPFCGGEAYADTDRFFYFIYCLDFKCHEKHGHSKFSNYLDAITAWNTRHDDKGK